MVGRSICDIVIYRHEPHILSVGLHHARRASGMLLGCITDADRLVLQRRTVSALAA